MINLNENEKGRLQKLAQDKTTIEALKKVFLRSFLSSDIIKFDVNVLAASRLAVKFLEDGFNALQRLQDEEENKEQPTNLV